MPLKKILIILIILLVVVVGALVTYNLFSNKEPAEPSSSNGTGQIPSTRQSSNQSSDTSIQGRLLAISEEPILSPSTDGKKVKYYSVNNGNLFESNLDGSELIRTSSIVLNNLIKAIWSPQKDKVITIFNENGLANKYFYDYNTNISTQLSMDMRWITWSPNQDKIAYQYYNSQTGDNNISISNPDGSDWSIVFQTRMKDLIVEWPDQSKLSIRTKPSGLTQGVVYVIDLTTNDFQKIINETYGLTALWSPLGNKILYSETNNEGKDLKLKIMDLEKQTISELNIITLAEKCVWSQDNRTIFCAVPKIIPSASILPDDYYKRKISFDDSLWRINIETEEMTKIFETQGLGTKFYNAKELLLAPLENYLLFVNQKDGLLYSLKL